MKRVFYILTMLTLVISLCSCAQSSGIMQDGYYTAETATFDDYGWKEYITIYVSDAKIVTVEYDARNSSGFIKSWDMDYMRKMNAADGTYPNEYIRTYKVALLNWQNPEDVDAVSGATESYVLFKRLAEAAMAQARTGDKHVAFVELP